LALTEDVARLSIRHNALLVNPLHIREGTLSPLSIAQTQLPDVLPFLIQAEETQLPTYRVEEAPACRKSLEV